RKLTNNDIKEIFYKVETVKTQSQTVVTEVGEAMVEAPIVKTEVAKPYVNEFGINDKYVFEKFVVGSHNELAHAASQAVAKNPGNVYNPLFIYGGVGLGKTHLVQAIGNHILRDTPDAKILYASCEKFTNDFIHAVK